MYKKINLTLLTIYYIFIVLPVIYFVIAIYSYYSVLKTFGRVPGNDELYELVRSKKLTIEIFPIKYGEIFLDIFLGGIFIVPLYILINYLIHKQYSQTIFYKKNAMLLSFVFGVAFILFMNNPILSWYMEYILD